MGRLSSVCLITVLATTCSSFTDLARASYATDSFFARFSSGAVTFPTGVASASLSEISFSPASLEDSLAALGVTDLQVIGYSWRNLPAGSTLIDFKDIYQLMYSGATVASDCSTCTTFSEVVATTLNYEFDLLFTPDDTFYAEQWHLNNPRIVWNDGDLRASLPEVDLDLEQAWDLIQGVDGFPVYVLDTGISTVPLHADLIGVSKPETIPFGCPLSMRDDPTFNHGTRVAGIIAAQCDNSKGVAGINCLPSATNVLVSMKGGPAEGIFLEQAICGFEIVAEDGGRIMNNSWGATGPDFDNFLLRAATRNAFLSGALLVAGAGNKGLKNLSVVPAAYKPITFAVSAVTHSGLPWDGAMFFDYIDAATPGGTITIRTTTLESGPDGVYTRFFGHTSACPPMACGVASLLLGINPNLTNRDLAYIMARTAKDIAPAGVDVFTGAGLISAYRSLRFISGPERQFVQGVIPAAQVAIVDTTDFYGQFFENLGLLSGDPSLPDAVTPFLVKQYKIQGVANFNPPSLTDYRNVWVRHKDGSAPGWSDADTIKCVIEVGWGDVDSTTWSSSEARLFSYTYALYDIADTSFVGYFPLPPDSLQEIPYSAVLGPFDDAPQVEVVVPNGGENWFGGLREINWNAADDDGIDSVSIYWSISQGREWEYELVTGEEADSTWDWSLASIDTQSTFSRIGVVVYDGRGDGNHDISDNDFTVRGSFGHGEPPGARLNTGPSSGELVDDEHPIVDREVRSLVFEVGRPQQVQISLYDVAGRKVKDLLNRRVGSGVYRVDWDLTDYHGSPVANGVYFYRFLADGNRTTGKLVIVR